MPNLTSLEVNNFECAPIISNFLDSSKYLAFFNFKGTILISFNKSSNWKFGIFGGFAGCRRDFLGLDFWLHSIIPVTWNPEYPSWRWKVHWLNVFNCVLASEFNKVFHGSQASNLTSSSFGYVLTEHWIIRTRWLILQLRMRRYLDREFPTRHGKMSSINSIEMRYGGHIQTVLWVAVVS